jgi:hypothetical protein
MPNTVSPSFKFPQMKSYAHYITAAVLLCTVQLSFGQKKDENIGTEVVNVVKPYTPTISDAFKVKETPVLDDEETTKKETIQYNIFSFPVASTFAPAKGRAANVDKTEEERLFKNYLTIAVGNYGNANAELFVTENVGESSYVGGMLRHHSSQGGINDLVVDDKFSNTVLDLTYGYKEDALSWTADLGYSHQIYNWYGINSDYYGEDRSLYDGLATDHTFHDFYLGSKIALTDSFFKDASVKYERFWDASGSAENRFFVKPSFDFILGDTKIKSAFVLDYVGGSFENDFQNFDSLNYGFANIGGNASFALNREDWTIDLGAAVFYSSNLEESDGNIFVYPQINASLKVVGDLMIFYAGADGTLEQNTYRDFAHANPFVSPTLLIAPTDRQYDVFAGLKGKLASNVSYNLRGSFMNEKNRAMFMHNPYFDANFVSPDVEEGYQYGNSFAVVYDDIKTLRFFAELNADFSKTVSFGVNATFSSYSTDIMPELYNEPALRASTKLDVDITSKWYAGLNVFFVGERKDYADFSLSGNLSETVTLDAYVDANAHVGYRYNDRLTAFLKLHNIANQGYERWLNYPVQQFQVRVGANYKFDF